MSDDFNFSMSEYNEFFKGLRDLVEKNRKYITIFKLIGFMSMVIALIFKQWVAAFLLWVMFFPDIEEVIKFSKDYYYRARTTIALFSMINGANKLFKSFGSFKDRSDEEDDSQQHHQEADEAKAEP